jgi:Peptidase inhibitor I78 family
MALNTTFSRSLTTMGLLIASTAGCAPAVPAGGASPPVGNAATSTPAPAGGTCNAAPAQFAVGQLNTAALLEQARVRSGARLARAIPPGLAVTMEFNPERLNLTLDAAGRVTQVNCG